MDLLHTHEPCAIPEEEYYKIGLFAAMNHTTVKALRFYEEQGLLRPARINEENGYRYYTMGQMADLHRITALKQAGFTLEEIAGLNGARDVTALLHSKRADLLRRIAELTRQVAVLDGYFTGGESLVASPVLIKRLPAVTVACLKEEIASYDDLFTLMPRLGGLMEEAGCSCAQPDYCFTSYPEPGYREEDIPVEVCQAVTAPAKEPGGLYYKVLPAVEAACIFHRGSYAGFPASYAAVLRFVEENGYEIAGDIRESYIDGVWNREQESDWLSEIQVPVIRKGE